MPRVAKVTTCASRLTKRNCAAECSRRLKTPRQRDDVEMALNLTLNLTFVVWVNVKCPARDRLICDEQLKSSIRLFISASPLSTAVSKISKSLEEIARLQD